MEKNKATSPEKKAALKAIRDELKCIANHSQAARLPEALSRFLITTYQAIHYLDVYHCPARTAQLRQRGHEIITHWQTVITESGERHRVGMYLLACTEAAP